MFHGSVSLLAQAGTGTPPAGGAALGQIAIASIAAALLTVALLAVGQRHREGRTQVLDRAGAWWQAKVDLPPWVAFPAAVATTSLVTAVFGMYWDIALHIGVGRDEGPLANPAHYFILAGLFGIFSAGYLAMVMPKGEPGPTAIRITRDWHAPLGGVLICACGAFSLVGFPLDDVWHRIFGQDVTLWGPTHLMLIGGAAMTLVGISVLLVEGVRAEGKAIPTHPGGRPIAPLLAIPLGGGLLLGLSTFQAEFDFGVPQFRFVFQPILIMVAAGCGLVAMRRLGGAGAAVGSVAFFLLVRGVLSVLVGPILGETTPHFPLYVVEALLVEGTFLAMARAQPLQRGLVAGALIGTVGLAAEWGWSHVWMPLPWPSELLPEGALYGFAAAIAGALLGTWVGERLQAAPAPRTRSLRLGALVGAAALAIIVASALYKPADEGVRATVALTDVTSGPQQRTVQATVRMSPASAADDAEWLTATAWQGDGLVVDRLRRVSEGVYRTTQPIPVNGNWKALVRLHHGSSLTAVPMYLPDDPAIPAEGVDAPRQFTRGFVADHTVLQREQKSAAGWLTAAAYLVVVAISAGLLALLAWGLHRLTLQGRGGAGRRRPRGAGSAQRPAATPA